NHDILLYVLLIIAAVLLVGAVMQVADNYLRVESRKHNVDSDGLNLLGAASSLFGQKLPDKLKDASVFILKRGYDIKLEGEVSPSLTEADKVTRYALQPPNFKGLASIPKVIPEIGDSVKAGQPIFYD